MKTAALAVAAFFAVAALRAEPTLSSVDLETLHFSQLRQNAGFRPVQVKAVPQDRVTQLHLLPDGGNYTLIGWADNQAQFKEAAAMWTEILRRAGMKPGEPKLQNGTYTIPYASPSGLVLRRFFADPKQFKPKDEVSLRENRDMVLAKLNAAGVAVVASYVANLDGMLPSYAVYYLTKADFSTELGLTESRVRILRRGGDIDFDILENAGVRVLQKPEPWILVYHGRAIGWNTGVAKTREEAEKKLAERVKYFTEQGKQIIGSRIHAFEPGEAGEYRFFFNLYLFQ